MGDADATLTDGTLRVACRFCDILLAAPELSELCQECKLKCGFNPNAGDATLWERLRLQWNAKTHNLHRLGEGGFGTVYKAYVTVTPQKNAQEIQDELSGRVAAPAIVNAECVAKFPSLAVSKHLFEANRTTGALTATSATIDLDGTVLANTDALRDKLIDALEDFKSEVKVTSELMLSASLIKNISPILDGDTFKSLNQRGQMLLDLQTRNVGYRYLNRMMDFTISPLPCIISVPRQGCLDDLEEFYEWGTPVKPSSAFLVAVHQVYYGLRYMHAADVAHNDIKPGNIICDHWRSKKGGSFLRCFLNDFGLSTPSEQTSGLGGTDGYKAPELVQHDRKKIRAKCCDAYSFALTMLPLLFVKGLGVRNSNAIREEVRMAIGVRREASVTMHGLKTSTEGMFNVAAGLVALLRELNPTLRYQQFLDFENVISKYSPEWIAGKEYVDDTWTDVIFT